jgi:DNA repair photolyase
LSNAELKQWSEVVDDHPRILVASEHTDPAFHVDAILEVLEGKRKVTHKYVKDGQRVEEQVTGKDLKGLYIITKHDGLPMRKLLETKIPKLVHFSITTLGGTKYEPGVMKYNDLLDRIAEYIELGLDPNTVTIRIDPIVPGVTNMQDVEIVMARAASMGIKRIKFSVMDAYSNGASNTVENMEKLGYNFEKFYGKNPKNNK